MRKKILQKNDSCEFVGGTQAALRFYFVLNEVAKKRSEELYRIYRTSERGLSLKEAQSRRRGCGRNEIKSEQEKSWWLILLLNIRDPLSLLLLALGVISFLTGDIRATVLIGVMVVLSVFLRFAQEVKADRAAKKLRALVRTTATVLRQGKYREVPIKLLVPGDIVRLSAGDMVPADVRLIDSNNLFINQAVLTGESVPVNKYHAPLRTELKSLPDASNLCFMGTNVESGAATAIVAATGARTLVGTMAAKLAQARPPTSFDLGVNKYTWLMIRFIAIMVPLVFLINGFTKGDWFQAFLFALAVAVGLTPELLPMSVMVCLSKGSLDLAKQKVIVKRLSAIQDFGAMNVLCTDKTGTLTAGKVALVKYVSLDNHQSQEVLERAFLNSFFQTGLKNLIDLAILDRSKEHAARLKRDYKKIGELPFDFKRRRMSVAVEDNNGDHWLRTKG
ncbi:MAG: HAD-IC family P-type ATPase, partial [bacterium]